MMTKSFKEYTLPPVLLPMVTPFQCKVSGLLAIVYLSSVLCSFYGITNGAIHVICNNKTALSSFQPWYLSEPTHDSFNLISSLRASLANSPLTWTTQHVYGHRDKESATLTCVESLNVGMDCLANQYRSSYGDSSPSDLPHNIALLDKGWSAWHNHQKIVSPSKSELYTLIALPSIQAFWTQTHHLQPKPQLSLPAFQSIDWDITKALMLPPAG